MINTRENPLSRSSRKADDSRFKPKKGTSIVFTSSTNIRFQMYYDQNVQTIFCLVALETTVVSKNPRTIIMKFESGPGPSILKNAHSVSDKLFEIKKQEFSVTSKY